jgi:hypothetical protein
MAKTNTLDRLIAAATRLKALRAEIATIEAQFPGLAGMEAGATARAPKGAARKRRKRKPMTAAQKAEVSRRMKAYWAKRRNGKKV